VELDKRSSRWISGAAARDPPKWRRLFFFSPPPPFYFCVRWCLRKKKEKKQRTRGDRNSQPLTHMETSPVFGAGVSLPPPPPPPPPSVRKWFVPAGVTMHSRRLDTLSLSLSPPPPSLPQ